MARKFAGRNMHIEFHTVNPKKEKAADCIYLTNDRICQHKQSYYYLSKCFSASCCPLRKREREEEEEQRTKQHPGNKPLKKTQPITTYKIPQIVELPCSLPIGCDVYSSSFGEGKLERYDSKGMYIFVRFGERVVQFQYPDAILKKYITLSEDFLKRVKDDVSKANMR